MSAPVTREDWDALMRKLQRATEQLETREVVSVRTTIVEFHTVAALLELEELAKIGRKFEAFLLENNVPQWNLKASTALGLAMGELIKKMENQSRGNESAANLGDVLLCLDFYEIEENLFQPVSSKERGFPPADSEQTVPRIKEAMHGETPTEPNAVMGSDAGNPSAQPLWSAGFGMDSIHYYTRLLKHDPASQVFVLLAEEFCSRKMWEEAVKTCRQGLAFHPQHLRGRVLLGWALWELGNSEEAERVLLESRRDLEKNAVLYKILAEIAERRGDLDHTTHFMNIYWNLQLGGTQLRKMGNQEPIHPPAADLTSQDPPIIQFLSTLLLKFEERCQKDIDKRVSLFSDGDREVLQEMLRTSGRVKRGIQ